MKNQNAFLNTKSGQEFIRLVGNELETFSGKSAYGLVSVFGSQEIGHDLDLLFYPSGDRKPGEYIKTHLNFLARIKHKLRGKNSDLIPFPMLEMQDEIEYLSKRKQGDIFLHNLIFTDYNHITERVPFLGEVINSPQCETIFGNPENLRKAHSTKLDYYYFTLINTLVQLSNYPPELLTKKNNHICGYVQKYALGKIPKERPRVLSLKDNLAYLHETLEGLDSLIAA